MAVHSSILAWEIHGQRTLAGYSPWGLKESDMTERLKHTDTHIHTQTHTHTPVLVVQAGLTLASNFRCGYVCDMPLVDNTIFLSAIFWLYSVGAICFVGTLLAKRNWLSPGGEQ